jgi:hypothetical protein
VIVRTHAGTRRRAILVAALLVAAFAGGAGVGRLLDIDPVGQALADDGKGKGDDKGRDDDHGGDDGGGDDGGGDDGGGDDGGGDDGGGDDGGGDDGGSGKGPSTGKGTGKGKGSDDDSGDTEDGGDDGSEDGGDDEGDDDGGDDQAEDSEAPESPASPGLSVERDGGGERVSGEVVLIDDRPELVAAAQGLGFTFRERLALGNLGVAIVRLGVPRGLTVPQAQARLASALPGVEIAANDIYRTQTTRVELAPDHPARLLGWTGTSPSCGAGAVVGVVDTAVDAVLVPDAHLVARSFLEDGESAAPAVHGTEVASILVGAPALDMPGLVPGVRLMSAEVFSADGGDAPLTTAVRIARALDWLVGERVAIVNLSLAGGDNAVLRLAVEAAAARGTVLVAAAGNGGPEAAPAYPAGYEPVVAVTAVDGRLMPLPEANRGDYIDFAAPGAAVPVATATGVGRRSGTSFAAPFVTATLAAMAAEGGRVPALLDRLARDASDLGGQGRDPVYGWGLAHAAGLCAATSASAIE